MIKFLLSKMKPLLMGLEEPVIFEKYGDISSSANKDHIINQILCGNIGSFFENNAPELDQIEPLSFRISVPEEPRGGGAKDEGRLR